MPKTAWGKVLMWVYVAGYWLYWLAAAITTWPLLPFGQWWTYVVFQALYATFWPILVLLNLAGFRW